MLVNDIELVLLVGDNNFLMKHEDSKRRNGCAFQDEHLGESYNPKIIISSIPNLIDNTYKLALLIKRKY